MRLGTDELTKEKIELEPEKGVFNLKAWALKAGDQEKGTATTKTMKTTTNDEMDIDVVGVRRAGRPLQGGGIFLERLGKRRRK